MIETGKGWSMILGDCLEVMRGMARVDAVVTDPPYGVDLGSGDGGALHLDAYASHDDSYENFCAAVVPAIAAAIALGTRAAVFSGPHIHEQKKPDAIGGIYCPAASARHCWGFKSFLPVLFYGSAPKRPGHYPTAIVSTETVDRTTINHPVPKPLGWMLWLIGLASAEGETILDPFAGSGTTGVACLRLGRTFIGIERDPVYFKLACDRLRAEEQGSTLKASRAGQEALFK